MSYIEKEPLLVKLKSLKKYWGSTLTAQGIGKAIDEVEKAEEVNIAETNVAEASAPTTAITGYWEESESVTTSKNGRETHSTVYTCSNCHASNGRKKTKYCPNCGAKMDVERSENGT